MINRNDVTPKVNRFYMHDIVRAVGFTISVVSACRIGAVLYSMFKNVFICISLKFANEFFDSEF